MDEQEQEHGQGQEQFPPRPGGMVERARQAVKDVEDAVEGMDALDGAGVEDQGYQAIRVVTDEPQVGTARTVTLSASSPVRRILPRDTKRRNAMLLSVDNDVYLTGSQGLAYDVQGSKTATQAFYLPAGIAIPISNQDELWVAATTTTTSSRVSVIVSLDGAR